MSSESMKSWAMKQYDCSECARSQAMQTGQWEDLSLQNISLVLTPCQNHHWQKYSYGATIESSTGHSAMEFRDRSWLKIHMWVVAHPSTAGVELGKLCFRESSSSVLPLLLLRKFRNALLGSTIGFLLSFSISRVRSWQHLGRYILHYLVFCMSKLEKSKQRIECGAVFTVFSKISWFPSLSLRPDVLWSFSGKANACPPHCFGARLLLP